MIFQNATFSDLREILEAKRNETISVPKEYTSLSGLDDALFDEPIDVPPTPMALLGENFTDLINRMPDSPRGQWTWFTLNVYARGGQVHYRNASEDTYEVFIVWPGDK